MKFQSGSCEYAIVWHDLRMNKNEDFYQGDER